jgi:putative oxidoreductase
MNRSVFRSTDYALLILRLATVFVFLPHGIGKALNWPMASSMFSAMGFPGFLGPITGIAEVLASLLLLVGLLNKWASLAFLTIMAAAITGVHLPLSWAAGSPTPGLERDILLVAAVLTLMAFGPGSIAIESRHPALGHSPSAERSV